MNNIIDADAAKLAGLQIDLLQKMRQGHITLDHLDWFTKLSKNARDEFVTGGKSDPSFKSAAKFELLADLGTLTVPEDYNHVTALKALNNKYCEKYYYHEGNKLCDLDFPNPTRIMKPGDKFNIRVFNQVSKGLTSSKERLTFLTTQKAVYLGAQGISLVFDQMRDELQRGLWYISFDEPDRLWKDSSGARRVTGIGVRSDGVFDISLMRFGEGWDDNCAFFCFSDIN